MFGFLKNLIKKSGGEEREQAVPAPPPPASPAIPAAPPRPVPPPPPVAARPVEAPAPIPAAVPVEEPMAGGPRLEIPYKSLATKLPDTAQKYVTNKSGTLELPHSIVLPQLSRGQVKISLGQLMQYSTQGSVSVPMEQKSTMIALPLGEILTRLTPDQLPKRQQRKVEVSEDIPDVFGKGKNYRRATTPSIGVAPAKPAPVAQAAPPAPVAPAAPPPAAPRIAPAPAMPAPAQPPELPKPPSTGVPPGMKPPAPTTAPIRTSVVLPPPVSKPAAAPPPAVPTSSAPRPAAPAPPAQAAIEVPMSLMTSHFSALGQTELANLHKSTVVFPARDLEGALKKGKVTFSWRLVKNWIDGAASLPGISDTTEIEFPLNVVAPIFLQNRKTVKPAKKLELTEDIPDLFARPTPAAGLSAVPPVMAPQPAPVESAPAPVIAPAAAAPPPARVAPVAPVAPEPALKMPEPAAPIPMPAAQAPAAAAPVQEAPKISMPKIEPSAPAPKPILDYGDIFGVPSKKEWTLNEVVQKCATLRGVAGAVITTADGLLIAGVWPDGVKTESAAAFMPQMFSRVAQYSRELNLGDPAQFTLLLENVPLQIFRTGGNYFTVLGKAGEPLPKVQLSALALRLAQTPNQK